MNISKAELHSSRRERTQEAKKLGYNLAVSTLYSDFRTIGYATPGGSFWASRTDDAFVAGYMAAMIADPQCKESKEHRFNRATTAAYFRRLQTASRLP